MKLIISKLCVANEDLRMVSRCLQISTPTFVTVSTVCRPIESLSKNLTTATRVRAIYFELQRVAKVIKSGLKVALECRKLMQHEFWSASFCTVEEFGVFAVNSFSQFIKRCCVTGCWKELVLHLKRMKTRKSVNRKPFSGCHETSLIAFLSSFKLSIGGFPSQRNLAFNCVLVVKLRRWSHEN